MPGGCNDPQARMPLHRRGTKVRVKSFVPTNRIDYDLQREYNLMDDLSGIIADLEQQRDAIDRALAALREIGGEQPLKRRGRSPRQSGATKAPYAATDGRQRQIEAMRRYWAAKKALGKAVAKKATKRRGLTAAGRRRLSELMKARWASKNPPKPVAKKKKAAA
jgi:hypothetical protein